jgi:hypothetical protein
MPSDIQIYCGCMARIRDRLNIVRMILAGEIEIGLAEQTAELIFVQFRKSLEGIAFSTLAASEEKYSEVYANFSRHWRAAEMLSVLDNVNPNFYPVPLPDPVETLPGAKFFGRPLAEGFLTRDDFVCLYQSATEVLHTHNPYREGEQTLNTKFTIEEWAARLERLLAWHRIELLNGDEWFVNVPARGRVGAWTAFPGLGGM